MDTHAQDIGWDIFRGGKAWSVASDTSCSGFCARLMALREHWTGRKALEDQVHLFHTLGAATYLDPPGRYAELASATNPVLRETFMDLYDRVAGVVELATGIPARLSDDLALPGFHIFQGDPRVVPGLLFGGTIHMDKPHERHRFPFHIEGTLSFTLPLALPQCGGGMYHWHDLPDDLLSGPKAPHEMTPDQYAWFDVNKSFIAYTVGEMVLHDGLTVHQLANPGPTCADDYRISMQGHGVLGDGAWHLFF